MRHRTLWLHLGLVASVAVGASPLSAAAQVCGFVSIGPAGAETEFHAANFRHVRDVRRWAAQFGSDARLEVLPGTCASQSQACTFIYAPVCATLNFSAEQTYSNLCTLRVAALEAAGRGSSADAGVVHDGACEQECASSS